MRESVKEGVKAVLMAVVVAIIVIQFVVPTTVYGISMEPTFESSDYLLISRQAYRYGRSPERGDIVVFSSQMKDENGEEKKLIKRVIGLPGETVAVENGKVYIDGKELSEDYTKDGTTNGTVYPVEVPEGCVFCLGDNRLHSTDSRFMEVGFIDEEDIVGKVVFRVYPFDKIGFPG